MLHWGFGGPPQVCHAKQGLWSEALPNTNALGRMHAERSRYVGIHFEYRAE